jgi:hypothetical protein
MKITKTKLNIALALLLTVMVGSALAQNTQVFLNSNLYAEMVLVTDSISSYITTPHNAQIMVEASSTASPIPYIYDGYEGENDQLVVADEPVTMSGVVTFTGANTHSGVEVHTGAETHSGAEVFSGAPVFTGNPELNDINLLGRRGYRENFDMALVFEEDFTDRVLTNGSENVWMTNKGFFTCSIVDADNATADPCAIDGTGLLLDGDAADDVGATIYVGDPTTPAVSQHAITVGTDTACFVAEIDTTDESEIDTLLVGWVMVDNDVEAFATHNSYALTGIGGTATEIYLKASINDGADQSVDTTETITEGTAFTVGVCIGTDKKPDYYLNGTLNAAPGAAEITFDTSDVLIPAIFKLNATGDATPDPTAYINYWIVSYGATPVS